MAAMLAMQYSIALPEDYDLQLIHARVAERVRLFASLPGLAHKSYLLDTQDRIYAPFYIWTDVEAAQNFLFDDLFRGVIRSFSRPRVRTWFTLARDYGNRLIVPRVAMKELDSIAPEENLEEVVKREREEHAALLDTPGLYLRCLAFDSERWEILRYSLWQDRASALKPSADSVEYYDALDVSDF
jgi:hypothetical protein